MMFWIRLANGASPCALAMPAVQRIFVSVGGLREFRKALWAVGYQVGDTQAYLHLDRSRAPEPLKALEYLKAGGQFAFGTRGVFVHIPLLCSRLSLRRRVPFAFGALLATTTSPSSLDASGPAALERRHPALLLNHKSDRP
jgi:hypothetical protein